MLNATLFGQMITFSIFAWVVMKFILPNVNKALDDREQEIANGLQAAAEGKASLSKAADKVSVLLADAKLKVAEMIKGADAQSEAIVSEAKVKAVAEKDRQIMAASKAIAQQQHKARGELKSEVADMLVLALEKILPEKVDAKINQQLLEELIVEQEDN